LNIVLGTPTVLVFSNLFAIVNVFGSCYGRSVEPLLLPLPC